MHDLRRLIDLSRPWRGRMALGIALSVVVILSNVALLALSGWFITGMALAGLGLLHLEFFAPAAAIRGLAVLRTVARYLERLVTHDATFGLLSELRVWLFRQLEPLAPARIHDFRDGDVLARFKADVESLGNFYLKVLVPICAAAIASLSLLAALAAVSPKIALIELAALFLAGFAVPLAIRQTTAGQGSVVATERAALQAGSADLVRGLAELQVYGAVNERTSTMLATSARLIGAQRRLAWTTAAGNALSGLFGQVAVLAAFVALFATGGTPAAEASGHAMLLFAVMAGGEIVSAMPGALAAFGVARAAAARIFAIADIQPAVTFPDKARDDGKVQHFDIAFKAVSMRYRSDAPLVLDTVSFALSEGQCLALVGPSGSGKSTVLDLIQHFWEPEAGEILIGGRRLGDIPDGTLRRSIAVVGQSTHLFNATIRDNLLLVRPDATDETLWAALTQASIDEEVRALPGGLDTIVGELGAQLSGGQARRIAIARAFLSDAPIVLLDEPTEGLDTANALRVSSAIGALIRGRTAIVVSHRAHAMTFADMVLAAPFGTDDLLPRECSHAGRQDGDALPMGKH